MNPTVAKYKFAPEIFRSVISPVTYFSQNFSLPARQVRRSDCRKPDNVRSGAAAIPTKILK